MALEITDATFDEVVLKSSLMRLVQNMTVKPLLVR